MSITGSKHKKLMDGDTNPSKPCGQLIEFFSVAGAFPALPDGLLSCIAEEVMEI